MNYLKTISSLTRLRDTKITKSLLKRKGNLSIYQGKVFIPLPTKGKRKMLAYNLGQFAITKKLGKSIHNSEKSRKRKNKQK